MAAKSSTYMYACIADTSEPGELNILEVVFGLQTAMRRSPHAETLTGSIELNMPYVDMVRCSLTTEEQVSIRSGNYAAICVLKQQWCAFPGQACC